MHTHEHTHTHTHTHTHIYRKTKEKLNGHVLQLGYSHQNWNVFSQNDVYRRRQVGSKRVAVNYFTFHFIYFLFSSISFFFFHKLNRLSFGPYYIKSCQQGSEYIQCVIYISIKHPTRDVLSRVVRLGEYGASSRVLDSVEYLFHFTSKTLCVCVCVCMCDSYYHRRKWKWRPEFRSWTGLFGFHIALIPWEKVWI